jgi:hypothetical protein
MAKNINHDEIWGARNRSLDFSNQLNFHMHHIPSICNIKGVAHLELHPYQAGVNPLLMTTLQQTVTWMFDKTEIDAHDEGA